MGLLHCDFSNKMLKADNPSNNYNLFISFFFFLANISEGKNLRKIHSRTQRHLDWYARDGLRTLCIAKKVRTACPIEPALVPYYCVSSLYVISQ